MTHTREQVEAARAYLARMAQASAFSRETADAIEVVLAATVEPADEELAREAHRAFGESGGRGATTEKALQVISGKRDARNTFEVLAQAYASGARREGRRAKSDQRREEIVRALGGRCDACKQIVDHARVCPIGGSLGGRR